MKTSKNVSILAIDNDPKNNQTIHQLKLKGYQTTILSSPLDALDLLEQQHFDLVITDLKTPEISGMDVLRHIKENHQNTGVLILTADTNIKKAVDAVKMGAEEYLVKPYTENELFEYIERALENTNQSHKREILSGELHGIIGKSMFVIELLIGIKKISKTQATVLISGESGTGKELVARAIHYESEQRLAPFISINCATIQDGLLESELFGYKKGAFTGAISSKEGFFKAAEGGTIFLDEISETTPAFQAKLLKVLQEKKYYAIGDTVIQSANVRIITATNKNLQELVKNNIFREDLYYRLNVIALHLKPLRERENDLIELIDFFIYKYVKEYKLNFFKLSKQVILIFQSYPWPGNIRELENLIHRLVVLSTENEEVKISDLPEHMRFHVDKKTDYNKTLEQVEKEHIKSVLYNLNNNKSHASKVLGINRKTLLEKIKKYHLNI